MSSPDDLSPSPPTALAPLWARWEQYTGIREPFYLAARFYVDTAFRSLKEGNFGQLYGAQGAGDRSFAQWYKSVAHHFRACEATTDVPALVGRAYGVVLELGPATGNQFEYFDTAKLTHVYGVEPNTVFAGDIADRLTAIGNNPGPGGGGGLRDKYTPIFCGVEDAAELAKHGIVPGTIDCIVSMQVMCSVAQPREVAAQLYRLLKPGGEILFWEHQRNGDWLTWLVQWIWTWVWSIVIGGCRLDRPTKDILLGAGEWEVIELQEDSDPSRTLPRVWGRLVKPGGIKPVEE